MPFRQRLGCSVTEACEALPIGKTKMYELLSKGRIKHRKYGSRIIIDVPSLLKLIDGEPAASA
jgi:excisionase family DNA binding protein